MPASASVIVSPAPVRYRSIEARRAARLKKFKRERLVIDCLNRGVSVAEIAVELGVTEKRMRTIVREILAAHLPRPPEEFVALQISRLNEALLVAYSAMSEINLKAVDRVVRIVRELDRYHGFFAVERRSLSDSRRPTLSEARAEEPLAHLADRPEMAPQALETAQSTLENAMARMCHSRESGNPESPGVTSPSSAALWPWIPASAGMTEDGDRPETAPQAPEESQSAPENAMAGMCHSRESGNPESPGATSPSCAPCAPGCPHARAGQPPIARSPGNGAASA